MRPGLGLGSANSTQGFETIPANTLVTLVTNIRPGTIRLEGLLKRTSRGDAEYLDVEFTVMGGPFDKRKIWSNMILDGMTSGHAKAGEISRSVLRAIFEAIHGLDPKDETPATRAHRDGATLAGFQGATFLATLEIEAGGKKTDGSGFYKDKNVIGKVLRLSDHGYRKLDQPPPAPIARSAPPAQSQTQPSATAANSTPAVAPMVIARPSWAD